MPLPSLPQDKANHVIYGAVIALAAYWVGLLTMPEYAARIALAAAVVAGAGKEVADRLANLKAQRAGLPPPHGVELWDALATWAGGAAVFVAACLDQWV